MRSSPSQSPLNQRTKKHFETDPASTRSAATETETEVDPSDSSSAAGQRQPQQPRTRLTRVVMSDWYEDEPLTAGQQAALEAAADAVAAGRLSLGQVRYMM